MTEKQKLRIVRTVLIVLLAIDLIICLMHIPFGDLYAATLAIFELCIVIYMFVETEAKPEEKSDVTMIIYPDGSVHLSDAVPNKKQIRVNVLRPSVINP